MASWNAIVNSYCNFLKCDWWNSKPIVCSKPKLFYHRLLVSNMIGRQHSEAVLKFPHKIVNRLRSCQWVDSLQNIVGGKAVPIWSLDAVSCCRHLCWRRMCLKQMSIIAQVINPIQRRKSATDNWSQWSLPIKMQKAYNLFSDQISKCSH